MFEMSINLLNLSKVYVVNNNPRFIGMQFLLLFRFGFHIQNSAKIRCG